MRRLEEALKRRTGRGDPRGAEWLIEHLDRRLAGEAPVVVGMDGKELPMLRIPRFRWRGPLIAAGTLVIALAVALPILLLSGGDDAAPIGATTSSEAPSVTTAAPATTAASVTTAAPSTTAAASVVQTAVTWERVPEQPAFERAALYDVVEYGGRLVAVGYALEPGAGGLDLGDWASDPAVWVSDDGVEWRRIEDPDLESDDRFELIDQVVAGPNGLLAQGTAGDLIIWSSPDGEEWDRVAEIGGVGWFPVIALDDGWLAIGQDLAGGPQVMRSSDGSEWTAVTHPAFASIEPGYITFVADVAATDAGIVAVGNDMGGDNRIGSTTCGAIWFSRDGETWERIAPERICEAEAAFDDVAVSPSGAVYAHGDRDLWVSTDPADPDSWQPMGTGDGIRCAPEAWLGDIAAGDARFFAGYTRFCVSEDAARTWLPIDRNADPFADSDEIPAGVVAFEGRFVAVGYDGYRPAGIWRVVGGGTGAVWIGTPTGE